MAAAWIVIATSVTSATASTATNPADVPVQPAAVVADLAGRGYSDIHDIEWDDGRWEVEAVSPQGKRVDIEIDPTTGEILHEEID